MPCILCILFIYLYSFYRSKETEGSNEEITETGQYEHCAHRELQYTMIKSILNQFQVKTNNKRLIATESTIC